jgi:hypothetical protein
MRLFSFIFAFYFLLLAVMPCNDALAHNQQETCKEQACSSHIERTQNDHHPAADVCSPLCMCNCCGGITIMIDQIAVDITPVQFTTTQHPYIQQLPAEIAFSIWQPPKV